MGALEDLALPIIFMILLNGVTSRDMEVFVNDTASIRCSPNRSVDIQWHHNSDLNYVYAGRRFFLPYKGRFRLEKDETIGDYDLIIPNVTLEDAGWYLCQEELSGHRISTTQLTVLYMKPVCSSNMPTDGFIGPNTCNIQQENMMFSCDVVFNGNAPHLSWRSANDSQMFNSSSCEVKSNRSSCSLTLRADPSYDGSVFRCDVGQVKLDDPRYSCNTKIIKVQYFCGDYANVKKYVHETVSCEVRSNLNVRYHWTLKQDNEEIILTSKQTISIEKPGFHQCEVEYSIRTFTCSTLVSVVNATMLIARTDAPKEQSNTLLAVTLPIALVVSVIALIGSTIYILKLKRQVNLNKSSPEIEMSLIVNNCDYLHGDRLNMEGQKQRLTELIESEFGLLYTLVKCGALTNAMKETIESKTALLEKNELLLNYIFSENKHQDLMQALSDCGQHHVVNWVIGNGEFKNEYGFDWPLREAEENVLDNNHQALVDLLNVDGILPKLYDRAVIDDRQRVSIDSKPTEHERNEALLDAVRRFSLKSYFIFKECLRQSGQSHVADILDKGAIIVPVHATLECENLDEVETRIVNEMSDVLKRNSSVEQADRLVAALQLRVMAMRRGQSIVSYISCIKEEEFIHLCKIIDNLDMRNILEQLFNLLILNVKFKVVLVSISSEDNAKAQRALEDMKSFWISKVNISDLSLELIDIILEKSYLLSILRQKESLQNPKDEVVIKQLASVDFCCFQRIARRRFKNVVWSKMKKYYEERHRPYFIYKNNQQFFEEIHAVNVKTKKRQTENQMLRTAFLAPENEGRVSDDLLNSYDLEDQEVIEEIMNTGGGAARFEIKRSRPLTEFELIPQQFEGKEMKILRSLADRHAVVWIWCHCSNALQKLNNRDGLKKLIEIVRHSVKATADVSEHRTNIDYDQLKKKIVAIPSIFLDFKTTLNFRREKTLSENKSSYSYMGNVFDVTKLKMKIYVLCAIYRWNRAGNSSEYESAMICVFEDRNPYPIVEVISLKRFHSSEFTNIVSSVKENCLYVLTSSKIENHWVDEVIRVEIKENGANSPQHPSKWLELEEGYRPHTLSISKDGDLMMFNTFSPIILRIYYPDARLRISVELHEDIRKTFKAVETSNGNFIVMHTMKRQTEYAEKGTHEEVETVSEVSRDGKTIIRRFIPQNQQQQLFDGRDLCIDSRDRVFVVDKNNHRVFVLDSCLRWIGNLIPQDKNRDEMKKLLPPSKLFYDEVSHEVIIAEEDEVHIYYLVQCFPTCVPRHTNVPSGVPRLYAARGGRTICRPEKEVGFK